MSDITDFLDAMSNYLNAKSDRKDYEDSPSEFEACNRRMELAAEDAKSALLSMIKSAGEGK